MFATSSYSRFDEAVMKVIAVHESTYSDLVSYRSIIDKKYTNIQAVSEFVSKGCKFV